MRRRSDELATGEWAALAVVAEAPTHGFAVARTMESSGDVGRVWAMRRPLVYRTLDVLAGLELIREAGTETSTTGPRRTLLEITPAGRERLEQWLSTPVEHVRDARSELMLKLLFLGRAGTDLGPLLAEQRERFGTLARELEAVVDGADGFARTLALWRLETTRAAVRFVDATQASPTQ